MAFLHLSRVCLAFCFLDVFLLLTPAALAIDIDGVQPVAYDLPKVNFFLRRAPTDAPLGAVGYEMPELFNIIAYLDTGTSSILLSHEVAYGMQIASSTYDSQTVTFRDVGVYGAEEFDVSERLYGAFAPTYDGVVTDNWDNYDTVYNQTFGPVRTQIFRTEDPSGGLDILGMPAMAGKVVVINPKPLNALLLDDWEHADYLRTYVYDKANPPAQFLPDNAASPGIPTTLNRHVQMSYGNFSRFTEVVPNDAEGPVFSHNPFIGTNPAAIFDPTQPVGDNPGITITMGTNSTTGNFLFDTGGSFTIISTNLASSLNIRYVAGTQDSTNPQLEYFDPDTGVSTGSVPDQFQNLIGGIGGSGWAAGFYLTSLLLPTMEATDPFSLDDPNNICFLNAPVLIGDIGLMNPQDNSETFILDGVFGMNNLVASAFVIQDSTGMPVSMSPSATGEFNWIVFDETDGVLGLDVNGVPEPGTFILLAVGGLFFLIVRVVRRRR